MIHVSETAKAQLMEILGQQEGEHSVRLSVSGRGPQGFEYDLTLLKAGEQETDDIKGYSEAFNIFVEAKSENQLDNATVDFVEENGSMGFKIDNPNPLWSDPVAAKVQEIIDQEINPGVASHGGHVILLDVQKEKVFIKMGGGCQGCGMASVTLKQGVEVAIKKAVPQIVEVLDTTDHAAGSNPFYQAAKGGSEGGSPFAE